MPLLAYTARNVGHLLIDELTGAYQRAGLTELLADLARGFDAAGTNFALVMFDLDHLKTLNDVYGHATGDAALRAVAERTARVLRADDRLFRYGGDEFLLVLPGTTLTEAEAVARRVAGQVTANPVEAAVWVNVHLSMGVAATDEPGGDHQPDGPNTGTSNAGLLAVGIEQGAVERGAAAAPRESDPGYHPLARKLFERADARLYLAKRAGRNTVVAHDIPMSGQGATLLRESRLVARDEQLTQLDRFLNQPTTAVDERVLHLVGLKGVGFSRMLSEVAVRAGIAGRAVRRVEALESDRGVYLRALVRAYEGRLPQDPSEEQVAEMLAQDAEGHGLVVLMEGGERLDPGSRALLAQRLRRGGTKLVEVVADGEEGLFNAGSQVALAPLTVAQANQWLAAALGTALNHDTGEALTRAGEGLPAHIAKLLTRLARRLADDGGAITVGRLASVSPELINELARAEPETNHMVHLPQWPEPLVGRSQWLAGAVQAVGGARLTILVGEGGVGKSRLAAQLAQELAPEHAGGTYWVDVKSVQSAAVVPGLLAEVMGLEHTEDISQLAQAVDDEPTLLVLDELDGIADQAGWLGTLLAAAPAIKVIGTSRRPLRLVGERDLEVPELTTTSACELFRRGMEQGGSEHVSDADVAALVEQVGPNPLAIEMAAAWTRTLSVSELRGQLDNQPELLNKAPGLGQRTARFIDVTRQLMSEWERETLGTLALLPAGFMAETARVATKASPFYLLALLERSLIRREGERYTVHTAVSERYRAGLEDADRAEKRVVGALVEFAEVLNQLDGADLTIHGYRKVDAERANLVFALKAAAHANDASAVWPLVKLLRGYHDVRARSREGLEVFSHVAKALKANPDVELVGWVQETMALFELQTGNSDRAEARLNDVLEMLAPLGPTGTRAMAFNTLGILTAYAGRHDESLAALQSSADIRRTLNDPIGEAQARGNIAILLNSMDRHEEAYEALERALAKYRQMGRPTGTALTLMNLAELGRTRNLLPLHECIAKAHEALTIAENAGFTVGARDAAAELALGYKADGNLAEARAALQRAVDWARQGPGENRLKELTEMLGSLGD